MEPFNVSGSSSWRNTGIITIGGFDFFGAAGVTVEGGSLIITDSLIIGDSTNSLPEAPILEVTGSGTAVTVSSLLIGNSGAGSLKVRKAGQVSSGDTVIGAGYGALVPTENAASPRQVGGIPNIASVTVIDPGSVWNITTFTTVPLEVE